MTGLTTRPALVLRRPDGLARNVSEEMRTWSLEQHGPLAGAPETGTGACETGAGAHDSGTGALEESGAGSLEGTGTGALEASGTVPGDGVFESWAGTVEPWTETLDSKAGKIITGT